MGRTGLARWPVRESPGDSNSFLVGPPDLLSTVKGERIDQSRDGRRLAFCQDYANPLVLDLDHPGSPIRLGPQADVRYVAISPDGSWVATGSHNSRDGVKVWSLPGGRLERHFPNPGLHANPLFSPDGRWLATNLGNKLRLWTVGEWRDGPQLRGRCPLIFPRRPSLGHRGRAGSVRLVEAETGRLVASLDDPHQSRSNQATFSLDGSRLILTSEDSRAAHVWDLRAIRHELVAMGLDWDWPPLPEPDVKATAAGPLRVATDLGGHDFSSGGSSPQELDRLNEALEIDPSDLLHNGTPRPGLHRHGPLRSSHGRFCARPYDPAG